MLSSSCQQDMVIRTGQKDSNPNGNSLILDLLGYGFIIGTCQVLNRTSPEMSQQYATFLVLGLESEEDHLVVAIFESDTTVADVRETEVVHNTTAETCQLTVR